jgi:hypothetical protein
MHRTLIRALIFILLGLGSTDAQDTQKKRQAKGAATKLPPKAATATKPLSPPGSTGWTQWGGPNRNFTSDSKGLANSWPAAGPRRLWTRSLGDGYSGIAADGGTLYTMYRRPAKLWQIGRVDQEVVVALEANSGKTYGNSPMMLPTSKVQICSPAPALIRCPC